MIFMKKILVLMLMLFCACVYAADDNVIKYHGHKYVLKYSTKNDENGGFINEYFKEGENYNTWSEMIAVHHFPNMYSPTDQTQIYRESLDSIKCPSSMEIDEDKNSGIIDFILINNGRPVIMEFDVFKFEKSDLCGTVALQYAKRYAANTNMQVESIKKDFEKNRKKMIKRAAKFKIPEIVETEIDVIGQNNNKFESAQ